MTSSSTITFESHSDEDLESALNRIDRSKFEANYQACVAEIDKRKAAGRWVGKRVIGDRSLWGNRFFRRRSRGDHEWSLLVSIGGVIGIINILYQFRTAKGASFFESALALLALGMFGVRSWAGWQYWRHRSDTWLWRIILVLMIPRFQYSTIAYDFCCLFGFPIGFTNGLFKMGFSSCVGMVCNPSFADTIFAINIMPLLSLCMLIGESRRNGNKSSA